jgi:SAM-dependent methyltransferase
MSDGSSSIVERLEDTAVSGNTPTLNVTHRDSDLFNDCGVETIDWSQYDFIDLGCGSGGSIGYCSKRFAAQRGVGIDLSAEKVRGARAAGYDAFVADALTVPSDAGVRFVSMLDFLEHLPDLNKVEQVIEVAAQAATDFLFIRHPSFEGEAYLRSLGLRQYWWRWSGHPSHIHVSDYCTIFERLGLRHYFIRYREPILDSGHETILNIDAPINQAKFDPSVHSAKPVIAFSEPIWRAQDIFVALRAFDPSEWAAVVGNK